MSVTILETLPEIRNCSGDPPEGPEVVGGPPGGQELVGRPSGGPELVVRPSRRFGTGRKTLPEDSNRS